MNKDEFMNSPLKKATTTQVISLALNKQVLNVSLTKRLGEEWDESQRIEESINFLRK
jgi:hypothetical protein